MKLKNIGKEKKRVAIVNLNKIRNEILSEAKPYVIKYGWSEEMFKKLAKDSKFDSYTILSLFPDGYVSLTQLYLDEINNYMTEKSKKLNFIRLKVHERIRELCILRFSIMQKEKKIINKTFFYLLLPNNYNFCLRNLYKTVDQIWYLAGDSSTDFNFYSKRAILASIYSTTLLHFVNNNNFDETINLLNKQLKRVSKIPKIKERFDDFLKLAPHLIKIRKKFNFTKQ